MNSISAEKPILIAVIDSGIDTEKSDLGDYVVKSTGIRVHDSYIVEDENMEIKHEHGTIISMIIREVCPNVRFISINILDEELSTDGRVLLCAVDMAIGYKPDIIHMSLGTTKWKYKYRLKKLAKKAAEKNIIMVSACDNMGRKSYPACLKGVLGVKSSKDESSRRYYFKNGFFYTTPRLLDIRDADELTDKEVSGTSYAAGYITGYISRIKLCQQCDGVRDTVNRLKEGAKKIDYF